MELDHDDIEMAGANSVVDISSSSASAPGGLILGNVAMSNAMDTQTGSITDEENSINSPGPAHVSSRGLVPQTQFRELPSDEDSTSLSQTSLHPSGSQPVKYLHSVEVTSHPVAPNLPYASQRTGLVYDPRMRFHTELEIDEEEDIHPEDPRRIYEIYRDLVQAGLVITDGEEVEECQKPYKLIRIPTREAEPGEICLVHSTDHYKWMTTLKSTPRQDLIDGQKHMDSLYLHPLSFFCAKLSAGGAIEACRAVAAGRIRNAIAVIRPPGHHAEHDKPGGFCFFDNVAIAAKVCQKDFGDKCRKILILDWDVHHGNGVQQAFEWDPNVLYISLHVHKDGTFYPQGQYGSHIESGKGEGIGKNINIPWRSHGMRDGDYLYAFQHIVMPVGYEFDPDLVIISAGFDAAEGDMLGQCHVTPAGFAHMTHMLMKLAGGKVVACLEGGYNLRAIARSALAVTKTLMGEPPDRLAEGIEASQGAVDVVSQVIRTHSPFWKCLYPKAKPRNRLREMGGERLHDLLRRLQAQEYCANFKMADLWIARDRLFKSFDRQVLATDDYASTKPLLIIFHDPPEILAENDPHTGSLQAHNVSVTDAAKSYLEWAIEQKFSVIDVNMPKYLTQDEGSDEYEDADPLEVRVKAMRDCANYLWENYVEPYDATNIFLLGIGDASAAVTHLLSHADDISKRVTWVFNFTCEHDLRAVQRTSDDFFVDWYWKHSLCYVARDHQAWNPDRTRRLRRKYGNLQRSAANELNEILVEARGEVQKKILEETRPWRDAEQRRAAAPPPAVRSQGVPQPPMRTGSANQFGGELQPPMLYDAPAISSQSSMKAFSPTMPQFAAHSPEMPVRGSPSASPRRDMLKSPMQKLPPLGMFYSSPERGTGARSPAVGGSPSRRV